MNYTDYWFNLLTSPEFKQTFYALGVGALVLGIGFVVVAFAFYGRGREMQAESSLDPKWVMLFATWRDSLIITVLYCAQSFIYRYSDFIGLSEIGFMNFISTYAFLQPLIVYVMEILIVTIAVLRVIALTRFLSSMAKTG